MSLGQYSSLAQSEPRGEFDSDRLARGERVYRCGGEGGGVKNNNNIRRDREGDGGRGPVSRDTNILH